MNYSARINEALQDSDINIAYLSRFADKKLEKKLSIVQAQIAIAGKNKQLEALQLLHIWESQIIEARILKYDQHPQLDKLTEIEMEIARMGNMELEARRRRDVLQKKPPVIEDKPLSEEPETESQPVINQLKLF